MTAFFAPPGVVYRPASAGADDLERGRDLRQDHLVGDRHRGDRDDRAQVMIQPAIHEVSGRAICLDHW